MERITRKHLEHAIEILQKHGFDITLNHMQPGDATRTWAVETKGSRRLYPYRMTTAECMAFLEGMRAAVDNSPIKGTR